MSDIVRELQSAILTKIQETIGPEFKRLDYAFDLEKNSLKGDKRRFGCIPKILGSQGGICQNMTCKQAFEITLIDCFVNKQSDTAQNETVLNLYQRAFEIVKKLYLTKLGIPDKVMNVSELTVNEPSFLEENVSVLKFEINVLFRLQTF